MSPRTDRAKRRALALAALCAFSVVIRIPFFRVPMITDEGGAAYVARFWSAGYQPYRDMNYDRLQGLFLAYKGILAVFGRAVEGIRLAAALYNVGMVLAVFVLARALFGGPAGWVAGGLAAVLSTAPSIEGFTANAELFAVFPLTLSALMALKKRWFLAGLLAGAAVLFKAIGVSGLLLALLWVWITRDRWKSMLLAGAGFAVGPGLAAVHAATIGWASFWRTFVTHRAMAFSLLSDAVAAQLGNMLRSVTFTYPAWIAAAVLAIAGLLLRRGTPRLFLALWVAGSLFGMTLGGNWFPHYYTQLVPPLAVAAAGGALSIRSLKGKTKLLWSAAVALAAAIFLFNQGPYWLESPTDISLEIYGRPAYLISEDVAAYVRAHTKPDDTIYVAFGQAEVYYYADRKAAVPHQLFWHQIEANRDLWDEVVSSIGSGVPAVLVWVQQAPPKRWSTPGAFRALVDRHYILEKDLRILSVYRRR